MKPPEAPSPTTPRFQLQPTLPKALWLLEQQWNTMTFQTPARTELTNRLMCKTSTDRLEDGYTPGRCPSPSHSSGVVQKSSRWSLAAWIWYRSDRRDGSLCRPQRRSPHICPRWCLDERHGWRGMNLVSHKTYQEYVRIVFNIRIKKTQKRGFLHCIDYCNAVKNISHLDYKVFKHKSKYYFY